MAKLEGITIVSFTGPRPRSMKPYMFKPEQIKERLKATIKKLIEQKGASIFISGGALGFDQYAFECVDEAKKEYPHIQNLMAIPFEEQWKKDWNKAQVDLYMRYKRKADEVMYIDELPAYQKGNSVKVGKFQGIKYQRRNEYMVDRCQLLVSLYDGNTESGTFNCITYAQEKAVPILNLDLKNKLKYQML